MLATKLKGQITRDRKLVVEIPHTMAAGAVEVIVLHSTDQPAKRRIRRRSTHPAFGVWAKRADFANSVAFGTELRRRIEMRADGKPAN